MTPNDLEVDLDLVKRALKESLLVKRVLKESLQGCHYEHGRIRRGGTEDFSLLCQDDLLGRCSTHPPG